MVESIRSLLADEEGQALAETSLLLTFILLVCVIVVTQFGEAVRGLFQDFVSAYPV